jgi:hypothetical protein
VATEAPLAKGTEYVGATTWVTGGSFWSSDIRRPRGAGPANCGTFAWSIAPTLEHRAMMAGKAAHRTFLICPQGTLRDVSRGPDAADTDGARQNRRPDQPNPRLIPGHCRSLPSTICPLTCRAVPKTIQARVVTACQPACNCPLAAGAMNPATITASARLLNAVASSVILALWTVCSCRSPSWPERRPNLLNPCSEPVGR